MAISLHSRYRLRLVSLFFVLFAFLCIGQLFFLQVVRGERYAEQADRQYIRISDQVFSRGTIYFSEKNHKLVAAATLRPSFSIIANPSKIIDPQSLYASTSAFLSLDQTKFLTAVSKTGDTYEVIAPDVSQAIAEKVSSANLMGLSIYQEKKRFYPGNTLGAHMLGFVGWAQEGEQQVFGGRYGLERYYDDILRRQAGSLYINFFAQIFAGLNALRVEDKTTEADVLTTIEPIVQATLQKELAALQTNWTPENLGAIIMDPATGKIYAMAALPDFDPNRFSAVNNQAAFVNPLIENVYEMGSIVKPLSMAAALDLGSLTPSSLYLDHGTVQVGNALISNYDGKARGRVSMQEVLNRSLNTGMVHVMKSMGINQFSKYLKNYGLGEKTGIDLPNEIPGLIKNLDSPREVEHATAAFGQGIALTPIGALRALAALANGGFLVRPYLTEALEYSVGITDRPTPAPGRRILKAATSKTITAMLVKVVDEALAGGTAKMERYAIAAKTGTAQISKPEGGYYDDRFSHTFFGYFPASQPRFIVMFYMIHPKTSKYASETLTQPFMNLAKFLLNYYEVPPDR